MQNKQSPARNWRSRRAATIALAACALLLAVAAATALLPGRTDSTSSAATAPPPVAATVTVLPPAGPQAISPADLVRVSARHGTLTAVSLVDDAGSPVSGQLADSDRLWEPREALQYGRTYTLTVRSRGLTGVTATKTTIFTTLIPDDETTVALTTTSGAQLTGGGTYGVGIVIVAKFADAVTERTAAEKSLEVATEPPVAGSWYWMDNRSAHWRPEHYYAPGTRVAVTAAIHGVDLGNDLYGAQDSSVTFNIGDAHVSTADDATKQINVYKNGDLVRMIPTSMGMGGSETVGGKEISFWTQPGVYTVMDKANPIVMDSSTYGLPVDSALGYKQTVNYAVRLTHSGIYVHELETTVWAQGTTNVSHGCLNVNADNAKWFYEFAQPGDVFEVRGTGGTPLPVWQNGDWTMPWSEWLTGSALH